MRRLSDFTHGIPSHDTLLAVFRALDPEPINAAFTQFYKPLTVQKIHLVSIMAIFLLNENFYQFHAIALALILGGIALSGHGKQK